MSRTIRGSKGAGYDYWSRRPMSGMGHDVSLKRLCHRIERQQGRNEVRQQMEELEVGHAVGIGG